MTISRVRLRRFLMRQSNQIRNTFCTQVANTHISPFFAHPTRDILFILFLDQNIFRQQYEQAKDQLLLRLASYQTEGTGWQLARVRRFRLKYSTYQPRAGSGGAYIATPAWIQSLRQGCVINVHAVDGKCFLYAILAHLHGGNNSSFWPVDRVERYEPLLSELNTDGFSFPMPVKDVA